MEDELKLSNYDLPLKIHFYISLHMLANIKAKGDAGWQSQRRKLLETQTFFLHANPLDANFHIESHICSLPPHHHLKQALYLKKKKHKTELGLQTYAKLE